MVARVSGVAGWGDWGYVREDWLISGFVPGAPLASLHPSPAHTHTHTHTHTQTNKHNIQRGIISPDLDFSESVESDSSLSGGLPLLRGDGVAH